jgi:hypothetical protein
MFAPTRTSTQALGLKHAGTQLSKAVFGLHPTSGTTGLRGSFVVLNRLNPQTRQFSSTKTVQLKEYFGPPQNAPNIKVTGPAWHHPV